MIKVLLSVVCFFMGEVVVAQNVSSDTLALGKVTVTKDERIDVLGRKMEEYNDNLSNAVRPTKGYRLMLLSTNDRNQAMRLRSRLLQQFPDQKVYMVFQSPYIKIKFGNFVEKADAEKVRKQLGSQGIVTGNIYILPEMIEVKPEKIKEE